MASKPNHEKPAESLTVEAICDARSQDGGDCELWVHPMCQRLDLPRRGPLLAMADGRLMTVDAAGLAVSDDDGQSWGETIAAAHGQDPTELASCYLLETPSSTLVMVYLDRVSQTKMDWDAETGEPGEGSRCELHSVRSEDGGKTWVDRQTLLDEYNANFFGFIQTESGRLVLVAEHLVPNPGRWMVCSFWSDDEGQSWRRSNWIDLGGHGHHDGALEPTVAALSDGRLMMLIRTNLGRFWRAFSDDGGRYWRTIEPTGIDASTSPGHLVRLSSGRLVLVWNRLDPRDGAWPLARPDDQHSEAPASWHREELSIAVSSDDGATWSEPIVMARLRGGQLSYPQVVERRAGEIWVIPGFASRKWFNEDPIRIEMSVREADLMSGESAAG